MTPAKRQLIVTLAALAAVIALIVILVLSDYFVVGWILAAMLVIGNSVWVILISAAIFAIRSAAREAALEASEPQAVRLTVVITRQLAKQLRKISTELGMPRSKVRGSTYVTIAIDAQHVQAFGGGGSPKHLLSLPTSAVTAVTLSSRMAGQKVAPTMLLTFATTPPQTAELVPLVTPKVKAAPMPKEQLSAKVDAVQALLG